MTVAKVQALFHSNDVLFLSLLRDIVILSASLGISLSGTGVVFLHDRARDGGVASMLEGGCSGCVMSGLH